MSSPSLPGDREQPAGGDPVTAQIEAEIADHLATSAEQLAAAGLTPTEAREQTQDKFGDIAAIGRRCWWIKQGDSLMFRGAIIGLIVVLCVALAVTTVGSWQSQSRMADQMNVLTEQLKALAERPAPVPAVQGPLEVKGQVYVGSPDQPAAGAEIYIARVEDGEIVRRATTDNSGAYRSGPLTAGDYTLQAKVQPKQQHRPSGVQSAPIYVYPGVESSRIDLDVAWHFGRIQIGTSRPLPTADVDGKYTIESRLFVKVFTNYRRSYSWTVAYNTPPSWPAYVEFIRRPQAPQDEQGGTWFFEILSNDDLSQPGGTVFFGPRGELPEGQALVVAAVLADVLPLGYKVPPPVVVDPGRSWTPESMAAMNAWRSVESEIRAYRGPESLQGVTRFQPNDDFTWATRPRGYSWLEHLSGGPKPERPMRPSLLPVHINADTPGVTAVPITRGEATRLRIEIPTDLEEKIRALVDGALDAEQFQAVYTPLAPPFFTEAKITVAGSRPLTDADDAQTPRDSAH